MNRARNFINEVVQKHQQPSERAQDLPKDEEEKKETTKTSQTISS